MAVSLSSLTHRVRGALPHHVPVGHAQQLIAAALGYRTYQSYVASPEEPSSFAGVEHIVLDVPGLVRRRTALGYVESPSASFAEVLRSAVRAELPGVKVHLSESEFADEIRSDAELAIADSEEFIGQQAMTNTYGPPEFELEFQQIWPLNTPASDWGFEVAGEGHLDQDPDLVYHGDVIEVASQVMFEKIGRRMLGEMSLLNVGAGIKGEEPETDDVP